MCGFMQALNRIEQDIVAQGRVESEDLVSLRMQLYSRGSVGLIAADFLVGLHKRVLRHNPAFEHLYYRALRDHVLVDGRIDARETAWLRLVVFAGGVLKAPERTLLHELRGEALNACPEFDALFIEAMKMPFETGASFPGLGGV